MSATVRAIGVLALICTALVGAQPQARSQEAPPVEPLEAQADDGATVQPRGPVHEAYAQPYDANPRPGPVVPKKPPAPITEVPPDQKPEGDNVQWIPGYWAWDSDRNDFLWVSGFWRVPPPDRKWVPGHWGDGEGGWQWVPGFWAAAERQEAPYQEPPPASLDYGPSMPAPDEDSIYSPGCWVLRDSRYLWRPGYWMAARPGFVWCPAHYCSTPAGCVFVDGYWDYPLADRGLLFAPVAFDRPLWESPGWCYRPSYCVNLAGVLTSLFVRPDYCHYYFGDYYGSHYAGLGFRPWCLYGERHHDPLFAYDSWRHRGDPGWSRGLRGGYLARLHGDLPRPPRTLRQQHELLRDGRFRQAEGLQVVNRLDRVPHDRLRLTALSRDRVLEERRAAERFHEVSRQRQSLERPGGGRNAQAASLSLAGIPAGPARRAEANGPNWPHPGHRAEPGPQVSRAVPPAVGREPAFRAAPPPEHHGGPRAVGPEFTPRQAEARPALQHPAPPPAPHHSPSAGPQPRAQAPTWGPSHAFAPPRSSPPPAHHPGPPASHGGGGPHPPAHGGGGGHGGGGHGGGGGGGGGGHGGHSGHHH
jgi:hypothetical protein